MRCSGHNVHFPHCTRIELARREGLDEHSAVTAIWIPSPWFLVPDIHSENATRCHSPTENLLGPLFVFMSPEFREVPSSWTFAGGGMLLVTLAVHELVISRMKTSNITNLSGDNTTTTRNLPRMGTVDRHSQASFGSHATFTSRGSFAMP